MDVVFGLEYCAAVKVGDKVMAGASVLARPSFLNQLETGWLRP